MDVRELDEMRLLCYKEQRLFEWEERSLNSLEIALDAVHILMTRFKLAPATTLVLGIVVPPESRGCNNLLPAQAAEDARNNLMCRAVVFLL